MACFGIVRPYVQSVRCAPAPWLCLQLVNRKKVAVCAAAAPCPALVATQRTQGAPHAPVPHTPVPHAPGPHVQVVGSSYQFLPTPNNATYIGSGKVAEVASAVRAFRADTVIFDDELSPGQLRNLEKVLSSGEGSVRVGALAPPSLPSLGARGVGRALLLRLRRALPCVGCGKLPCVGQCGWQLPGGAWPPSFLPPPTSVCPAHHHPVAPHHP